MENLSLLKKRAYRPRPSRQTLPENKTCLGDVAEQLRLEDELALLVLLGALVGLVVLPADRLLALAADDVADDVTTGRHVALVGFAGVHVDHGVEEKGLTMLAAEVL